jgi:hypothetical protein
MAVEAIGVHDQLYKNSPVERMVFILGDREIGFRFVALIGD